ncbi:MAG TPA: hypothetical protein VE402_07540, partial [Candidatus Angelobacter sp.]|nr:hypothetical protein [Candidatus Angelobacter sp.]
MTPDDVKPAPSLGRQLLRLVVRQAVLALPFAIFFNVLFGKGLRTFRDYYLVSAIFAYIISIMILVNRRWVLPRILRATRPEGRSLIVVETGSFALAAIVGSILAGLLLDRTLAHGQFFSAHGIAIFLLFTLLFCALFLGWVSAIRYQRRYADRIRAEAE